jgi:hypothetical protein
MINYIPKIMNDIESLLIKQYGKYIIDGNRQPTNLYLGKREYFLLDDLLKNSITTIKDNSETENKWRGLTIYKVDYFEHIGFGR